MIQNPKSKIPKIRPKKFGFWILGIWDFGFWGFWILDFGEFGFWRFWILGILGILDFWDFGDFGFWLLGFWGFWILGILGILGILDFGFWDLGDFGFWILVILGILDFGILGRSRGCTTRQFGDGAWRSEAGIHPGLPLGATSKPTVSNRVGARKQIEHFFRGQNPTKSQKTLTSNPEVRTLHNHRKT